MALMTHDYYLVQGNHEIITDSIPTLCAKINHAFCKADTILSLDDEPWNVLQFIRDCSDFTKESIQLYSMLKKKG